MTQERRDFGTEADELPAVPLRGVPVKTERMEIVAEDFTMESSQQQEATPGDKKMNDASFTVNEEKKKKDKKKRKRDSVSSKSLASEDKPNKKKRKISKSTNASMDGSFINSVTLSSSVSGQFPAMIQSTPKVCDGKVMSFPVFSPEGIGSSSSFDSAIGSVSLENSGHKKKTKHKKTPKKEKDSKKKVKHKKKKHKKEKDSKNNISLLDSGQFS